MTYDVANGWILNLEDGRCMILDSRAMIGPTVGEGVPGDCGQKAVQMISPERGENVQITMDVVDAVRVTLSVNNLTKQGRSGLG